MNLFFEHFVTKLVIVVRLVDRNRSNRANDVPTPQATNVMQQLETVVEKVVKIWQETTMQTFS